MKDRRKNSLVRRILHPVGVVGGAMGLSLVLFILLPLLQNISQSSETGILVETTEPSNAEPPPPAPPEEEAKPEPESAEEPPQLEEAAQPLDLSQLELALNPTLSEGAMGGGDFVVRLNTAATGATKASGAGGDDLDAIFSMADLDQKPRVLYQPGPVLTHTLRQKAPATVYILFIVNERGGVTEPRVQKTTDPLFEKPALEAVKQWKFEPGKRNGQPVRFRMRVPITFPKG